MSDDATREILEGFKSAFGKAAEPDALGFSDSSEHIPDRPLFGALA